MTKKTYIKDAVFSSKGTTNGHDWVRYIVTDQDNIRYAYFDPECLNWKGIEREFEYEEKPSTKIDPKTGQPYLNRTIVKPKKADVAKFIDDLYSKIRVLEARVTTLEKNVVEEDEFEDDLPELPI